MSDLISRSELLKRFLVNKEGHRIPERDCDNLEVTVSVKDVKTIIKEQPIAYDIDGVVGELCKEANETIVDFCSGCFVNVDRAIEIVKQGSVCSNCIEAGNCDVREDCPNMPSNDVCEWRIVDRPNNFPIYNTSCGKIRLQYSTGIDVYCNGCGKKIKVVE